MSVQQNQDKNRNILPVNPTRQFAANVWHLNQQY